jgi:hypothetical protein
VTRIPRDPVLGSMPQGHGDLDAGGVKAPVRTRHQVVIDHAANAGLEYGQRGSGRRFAYVRAGGAPLTGAGDGASHELWPGGGQLTRAAAQRPRGPWPGCQGGEREAEVPRHASIPVWWARVAGAADRGHCAHSVRHERRTGEGIRRSGGDADDADGCQSELVQKGPDVRREGGDGPAGRRSARAEPGPIDRDVAQPSRADEALQGLAAAHRRADRSVHVQHRCAVWRAKRTVGELAAIGEADAATEAEVPVHRSESSPGGRPSMSTSGEVPVTIP